MVLMRVISLRWLQFVTVLAGLVMIIATFRGFVLGRSEVMLWSGIVMGSIACSFGVMAGTVERLAADVGELRRKVER